jgi:predicted phage baseplate assembly protein
MVRRIPVYAPEWTDHNASDPGITLIELFAFLGENLLYRFNQIPEATKLAFLDLLHLPLRPAVPARALLSLTTKLPAGVLVPVRSEARAGKVLFETQSEVHAWPVSMLAVARARAAAPDPAAEAEVYEFAVRTLDALGPLEAGEQPEYYEKQTVSIDGTGDPVDFGATIDGVMWVAVLAEKGAIPDAILAAMADGALSIGYVPDPVVATMDEVLACPGAGTATTAPAVEWVISMRTLVNDKPNYARLRMVGDTTRGLTQQGVIQIKVPRDVADVGAPAVDADLGGTGDFPPVLDDETAARVLFWLRAFRQDHSSLPRVSLVTANATEVFQQTTARPEFLGTGNAQANQEYGLVHSQVLPSSLKLEVEESGGWVPWTEVDDFDASVADSRHYVLDTEAGVVRFGNGERGRPPQIGERIRAREYRYGGGVDGNVAAKAINKIDAGGAEANNWLRAFGGADKETIEAALDRIPGELRRRDRAVTATDFRELALQTPGANVGRAECLPRFHPPTRTPERAGIVTVVVWPQEDALHPDAPLPDANLLKAVCAWLDERRLVTTELYVVPPSYRKVAISVALQVKPGYGAEAVRRWVELVLRQYLAPLPPYGPSGGGWPLGRRVYGPELQAAALQVEGVEFLEELEVAGWDAATSSWVPGTVELAPYEVVEVSEIVVVEGSDAPPPGTAPAPAPGGTPVPVPVIREEC